MRVGLVGICLASFLAGGSLSGQQPSSADTIAYTTALVTLRDRPFVNAQAVARLPARSPVRLYTCSEGWCSVSSRGRAGYVLSEYLTRETPAPVAQTGRGYVNSQGQWVPSPTRTPDNQPPAGATAQCRDGTYSFSQSRRGTCSHHGGVARWL